MATIINKIIPCLWFDKNAEDAMEFYINLFNTAPHSNKSSKIISIDRYESDIEAPQSSEMMGKVITGIFELAGQKFMCLDGGPLFKFNESISLFVECEDQVEVDHFWNGFTKDDGEESMCGWLKDKFGVSWQIVPKQLGQLASDKDRVKAKKVINSMLKMRKIIISDLEDAFNSY